MNKISLNVRGTNLRADRVLSPENHGCRTHMVILPGYGKKDFPFPDKQTLVIKTLSRLEKRFTSKRKRSKVEEESEEFTGATEFGGIRFRVRLSNSFVPGLLGKGVASQSVITKLPEAEKSGVDGTLLLAAEGIRAIMDEGKYDAIVAERFYPLAGAVNWAQDHMEMKYQLAIASLGEQLKQLAALYKDALPRVLAVLVAQNPNVPIERLLTVAVEALDEEMTQILYVLRVWTDAFAQLRDGVYKELEAVVYTMETAFRLFETGDLEGRCGKGKGKCQPKIQNNMFKVGNVFLARFSGQGPATLPGSAGPIGAHALEVPHDERQIIPIMLVLYMHEFRHDIFADVQGLASELTNVLVSSIQEAYENGQFNFSTDKVSFGRNKFNTIDIIAKMFADTIGEVDADISGGVLLSGPAFLYNMLSTFSAFNSKAEGSAIRTERLLRPSSGYVLTKHNGQVSLDFLPHPPDYIRAFIVAAALDEIGFPLEAEECRRLAVQGVGSPVPEYITWFDAEGKSKAVIKIAVSDIKQVAPVVARALIRTPLKSLGGLSTFEIINWTRYRQDKVEMLVYNLMHDSAEVPEGKGDFYATYVAAAATLAYWGLVKSGVRPLTAARSVTANAFKMLDTVRARQEAAPVVTASDCCGKSDEADEADETPDGQAGTAAKEGGAAQDGKAESGSQAGGAQGEGQSQPPANGAEGKSDTQAGPSGSGGAASDNAGPELQQGAPKLRRQRGKRDPNYKPHPGSLWLEAHWSELPPDEWVAANGDGLVAHDADINVLMDKLAELKIDSANVAIAFNQTGTVQ